MERCIICGKSEYDTPLILIKDKGKQRGICAKDLGDKINSGKPAPEKELIEERECLDILETQLEEENIEVPTVAETEKDKTKGRKKK